MTEQEKREKVIRGLECCLPPHDPDCDLCPYDSIDLRCRAKLHEDVMVLLKAQEPKPVYVTVEINHRKIGECPNCRSFINSEYYPNYCGNCGQVVKWK